MKNSISQGLRLDQKVSKVLRAAYETVTGRLRDDKPRNMSGARVAQEWLKYAAVFVMLFTIGSGNAWAGVRSGWTRVTSVSEITSGGTFIVGFESTANSNTIVPMINKPSTLTAVDGSGTSYLYSGTASTSNNTTINMSDNGSGATTSYEFEFVTGSSSGTISIKLSDNTYVGFYGSSNNNCKRYSSVSTNSSFTPTITTNDVVTLTNVQYMNRKLRYNNNSGSYRFSNYSTAGNVVLYKKTQTCTLSSISLNTTSVQKTFCVGDAFNSTGLVTTAKYSGGCSDATVTPASVTVPSGAMNSAGTKTATVSYTEGGVTKTATYTITVQAKHTVTWMVNGSSYSAGTPTTQVCPGSHVTSLPTAPNPASYCGEKFVGWTDAEYSGNSAPTHLYKTASEFPNADGNQTFYAVFAYYAP